MQSREYAMKEPAVETGEVVLFGPFSVDARRRLLLKDGTPVKLGARTLDVLIELLSRPNEVICKHDLLVRVWPDATVDEGSLRFQIANLRRVLSDGTDGARYITTLTGRGYCFVAPISRSGERVKSVTIAGGSRHANLPARVIGMIGRNDDILKLSTRLNATRFVTIVGAGGVGKTTVAVAVGHHLIDAFAGAVLFVDLGMLSDPDLVATAVATLLGLSVHSGDATPSLIGYLRDKRMLLILDTCEHLIGAVAVVASRIFASAAQVHILATSRETLQVEGEHVYRLEPLSCPPNDPGLTAAAAQTFPATQLFLERAVASGARLDFSDAEAVMVMSICRKLDGMALAIELVARRVGAYGLQQIAALLDQHATLPWPAQRTAPPRQKTLQATLDWSYRLLSELECAVLRQLAVFVGDFTLDAALAVVTTSNLDQSLILGAIDSLVSKSMVATRPAGAMVHCRLLDTTRAYVLGIKLDDAELAGLAVRHATFCRRWLEKTGVNWSTPSAGAERTPAFFSGLNNVRAALESCFGVNGNVVVGVGLAAAAAPVFLAMSLLSECYRWSQQAILALDDATRGGFEEMHLQAALGISSMQIHGGSEGARVALSRSLAIAEERGDIPNQVGLLATLHMLHFRRGDFKIALRYARCCRSIAGASEDPAAMALAHSILGRSLQIVGDLSEARVELELFLRILPRSQRTNTIYHGYDCHYRADIALARTLWLQGHPTQAAERAHQAVKDAERIDHPASRALILAGAAAICLWTGDLQGAEELIDSSISNAEFSSLGPLVAAGRCRKAQLAIRRGNTKDGVESLQASLEEILAMPFAELATEFSISLVQGLVVIGRFIDGITIIDEAIQRVETNGDASYLPELLRMKGALCVSMPQPCEEEAEMYFMQSLELSRREGARAWELRTAMDLAALYASQGKSESGRMLLRPVLDQFVEGFDTADLKAAERLLATLG